MNEYAWIDQKRWVRRNLSSFRMHRLDDRPIPGGIAETRLYCVVRNEMLRLPCFLSYYRDIGVDRFFFVDNRSDDGTAAYLLAQSDAHVWQTSESYVRQEAWVDFLLRRYGKCGWSVVVDADELLLWPEEGPFLLGSATRKLESGGYDAVHAILLDMYPPGPLRDAEYEPGTPFLKVASCFDPDSHRTIDYAYRNCDTSFPKRFVGGVRERVFGLKDVCLSKFPLVRYHDGFFLRQGTHAVEGARIAPMHTCLLHFKYLGDFGPRVQVEAVRGEHWNGAIQYKAYAEAVSVCPDLTFCTSASLRYEGPSQLAALGIMQISSDVGSRNGTPGL